MTAELYAPQVLDDLEFITEHWDDLCASRRPGTARPWRQALIDPEQRARMLARDRDERAVRDPDAPGFTSAPEHVDVLDVIVDVWVAVDELTAAVSPDWRRTVTGGAVDRGAAAQGPLSPVTEITPMVEFVRTWLPHIADVIPEQRIAGPARRLHSVKADITRVLGLVLAGQMLAGAVCPWCRGVTPKHPAGGHTTMRVEEIPGSKTRGTDAATAVVCWNPLCEPPDDACGTRMRGRPAWPWHEWDWLAKLLLVADPVQSVPAPPPPRPDGFSSVPVLPIERDSRGISRTAPVTHSPDVALIGVRPDLPHRYRADSQTTACWCGHPVDEPRHQGRVSA